MNYVRLCIVLLFSVILSINSSAAKEYFISPYGEGLRDGSSISNSMPLYKLSAVNYLPGDIISILADKGDYRGFLYLDGTFLNGSKESPIIIRGINGQVVLDMSWSQAQGVAPLTVSGVNYLELENIAVRGNGGRSAIYFTNSGSAGEGYTVVGRRLSVLSNDGHAGNDHDGFDLSFNSQVVLEYPTTNRTHPADGQSGSHQSVTAHSNSHAIVYGGIFGTTNYWATPVDTSSITFYGGIFYGAIEGSFTIGGNGTNESFVKVNHSEKFPTYIYMQGIKFPKSNSKDFPGATIEIDGGHLLVDSKESTELVATINYGRVIIRNTLSFIISSENFRYIGMTGSKLMLYDNDRIELKNASSHFFQINGAAELDFQRNLILKDSLDNAINTGRNKPAEVMLLSNVIDLGGGLSFIKVLDRFVDEINIYQNTFRNGKNAIIVNDSFVEMNVVNNDFVNLENAISGYLDYTVLNNNFYNTTSVGENAINVNSLEDGTLLANQGVKWWDAESIPLDKEGEMFTDPPSIGPYALNAVERLVVQAENADYTGDFQVLYDQAQDVTYLEVENYSGNGSANLFRNKDWIDFTFIVQEAGQYNLIGSAKGLDSGSDSFWLQLLSDSGEESAIIWAPKISTSFLEQDVVDRSTSQVKTYYFEAGQYTVRVYLREDGTAIDWLGLEATNQLRVEAEDAIIHGSFNAYFAEDASEGMFVEVSNGTGNGASLSRSEDYIFFDFFVDKPGFYSINASTKGGSSMDDSFWLKVGDEQEAFIWDIPITQTFVESKVKQRGADTYEEFYLNKGVHRITVYLREDGSKLDWLELIYSGSSD